jgi:hypothetical protein
MSEAKASDASKSGIPNTASVCPALKLAYETCFQSWYYDEFLTLKSKELPCPVAFNAYQECVHAQVEKMGHTADLAATYALPLPRMQDGQPPSQK